MGNFSFSFKTEAGKIQTSGNIVCINGKYIATIIVDDDTKLIMKGYDSREVVLSAIATVCGFKNLFADSVKIAKEVQSVQVSLDSNPIDGPEKIYTHSELLYCPNCKIPIKEGGTTIQEMEGYLLTICLMCNHSWKEYPYDWNRDASKEW